MSKINIAQRVAWNIVKIFYDFKFYSKSFRKVNWYNERPMLLNGNVWCPMCDEWHANNSYCQMPTDGEF
jgi:hypothetical protein